MKRYITHSIGRAECSFIPTVFTKPKTHRVRNLQWIGLQELVCTCAKESAAGLITSVSETIDTFTNNCPKDDDLTLIVIEVSGEY